MFYSSSPNKRSRMADNTKPAQQEICKTKEEFQEQEVCKESGAKILPSTNVSEVEDSSQSETDKENKKNLPVKKRRQSQRDSEQTSDDKEEDDTCFNLKNIENNCPAIKNVKQSSDSSSPPLTPLSEQEPKQSTNVIENKDDITVPSDVVLQSKQSMQHWVKKFSAIVIDHLNKFGMCVIDNFIGEDRGTRILNEVLHLQQTTQFKVGTLSKDLSNQSVRSDQISWIDAIDPPCPSIRSMLHLLDAIILMANKTPDNGELAKYKISGRTKAMVACYPGGGSHYVRHVDNPNKDGRVITSIYYLNKNWIKEYGGTLMIYPSKPAGTQASVEPIFDRVIFFWSDRRNPHEVLPAYKPRYAITAWYFDTEEKNEYMKRQDTACLKTLKEKDDPPKLTI